MATLIKTPALYEYLTSGKLENLKIRIALCDDVFPISNASHIDHMLCSLPRCYDMINVLIKDPLKILPSYKFQSVRNYKYEHMIRRTIVYVRYCVIYDDETGDIISYFDHGYRVAVRYGDTYTVDLSTSPMFVEIE